MSEKGTHPGDAAELRRRAEEVDRGEAAHPPESLAGLSPEEARRTLHELRVHQIELEVQNEELRHAQAELETARSRYFDLYDLAPVGYCTVSKEGLILEANLTVAGLLGVARGALVKRRLTHFILHEDEDLYYGFRKRLLETGQPQACELRMSEIDGTPFWARLEASAAEDAGGAPVCRVVMSDITVRKQAEQALRESETKSRLLFEHSVSAIAVHEIVLDAAGRPVDYVFLSANPAFEAQTGLRVADILGHRVTEVLPGIEKSSFIEVYGKVALTGVPVSFEQYSGILARHFIINAYRVGEGRFAVVFTDITERKQIELALRESEEQHRTILLTAMDGFFRVNVQGRLLEVNEAYCRMSGYSARELLAMHISGLEAVETMAEAASHMQMIVAQGEHRFETRHRRKDGTTFDVEASVQFRPEDGGRVVVFVRDITDRKRAEEEKAKLEAQLHQSQKMESIGRLAGGVAHDFNNLLTVINGYSQMLLRGLDADHPMRANLSEIRNAGERAAGLTRQLLAYSRKQVLQLRRLDLNRVVEQLRPLLERLVGEDVDVRVVLRAEGGTVRADPHQLEQVIMNLAVNARDAMPGGGRLLIETARVERDGSDPRAQPEARAGQFVMLAVSDTGAGMDEETKNRIFEPFFTTKGVGKGTGLGLSTVQGVVAQSGGYIEVHSEPGQGTSFKIYLPALNEAPAEDCPPALVPMLGGKETVLVVEDQPDVRKYAVAVLREHGYWVIPAESAGEALLRGREHGPIDLLLTDLVMPNVSGRELADRFETLQPGIKVLFMSGYSGNVIERHGVLVDGAEFLQKPFNAEELARKVRAVLGPPRC